MIGPANCDPAEVVIVIDLGAATEATLGITDAVQKEDFIVPHGRDF